jgi:hypothetical protein
MGLMGASASAQVPSGQSDEERNILPGINGTILAGRVRPVFTLSPAQRAALSSSATSEDKETKPIPSSSTGHSTESAQATKKEKKKEKRGEIVIAPLPISSPALGTGVIPLFGYIFPFSTKDKVSPPSVVGAAALFTDNGSRALAVAGQLYLKQNTSQITAAYVRGNLNYDFYGTGTAAGNAGRKLAIKQTGSVFFGEFLHRLVGKFFLGPRVWIGQSDITPNLAGSDSDHPDLSQLDLAGHAKALGLRLLRDTRPNRFYATGGTLTDFSANFFGISSNLQVAGGGFPSQQVRSKHYSFQTYRFTFNKYESLTKSQVLAYNLYLCSTGGQAPFYGECVFGVNNELRGYTAARYIDRHMFATQLEYRLALPKRLGLVGFGGVGEVAPSVGQFRYRNLLPAGGAGLRVLLEKKYHVNLRVDVAEGKDGPTWSMSVGEAF